jgi:PAS domain S-box-containing protein
MDVSDYNLERMREDPDAILYRGTRSTDHSQILILMPLSAHSEVIGRIQREHALSEQLNGAWAVGPRGLSALDGRAVLILDDPGGNLLECRLGRPMELAQYLSVAIALIDTLALCHRQGLVHHDVTPSNIIVDDAERVRLTGFGFASEINSKVSHSGSFDNISRNFAYMSPEQTSRSDRLADTRSDLYSAGVILYEMLTGTLPFQAQDTMGWIHCHVARQPPPPSERLQGVPEPIEAIILRMLAKSPEARYQTAEGVAHDLRHCLAAIQTGQRLTSFALGQRDVPDRLMHGKNLYGRQRQIDVLSASYERVAASGFAEIFMVSGYSGVGKSSIINEFYKTIDGGPALVAAGKSDQYSLEIPYATITQAFAGLISQLLGRSDADLLCWNSDLTKALGQNGQLMVNLFPQLELIIGKQPPIADAAVFGHQGRFRRVFQQFIEVFANHEHPLVLILDDLQWTDAFTLSLLKALTLEAKTKYLLIVGVYRDNEVGDDHPLTEFLNQIRTARCSLQEMGIAPLPAGDLGQLFADILATSSARASSLAELVFAKTGGNPFFAIQFLSSLVDEKLLTFDRAAGMWVWDLAAIDRHGLTDNVAALLVGKLGRLPNATQRGLGQLASIGNRAKIPTLAIVGGLTLEDCDKDLSYAITAGVIIRERDEVSFVHDKLQEAAFTFVEPPARAELHLRIARAILLSTPAGELEENIFEIADHFNNGLTPETPVQIKIEAAGFNLLAAKRAKQSSAYQAALTYTSAGTSLLDEDCWGTHYQLMFDLFLLRSECALLNADLQESSATLVKLRSRARSKIDMAAICCIEVDIHMIMGDNAGGVRCALDCLLLFGVDLPFEPTREQFDAVFSKVWGKINGRAISSLIDLPRTADPEVEAAMRVLQALFAPAAFSDEMLLYLNLLCMVETTLDHGITEAAAGGLGWFGMVLGHVHENYADGYQFGLLADAIVARNGFIAHRAKTLLSLETVSFWARPVSEAINTIRESFDSALASGDVATACFSRSHLVADLLERGDHLDTVLQDIESGIAFCRAAYFNDMVDVLIGQQRYVQCMRGETDSFAALDGDDFDTASFEALLTPDRMRMMRYFYWVMKGSALYMSGQLHDALQAFDQAGLLLTSSMGHAQRLKHEFFRALTLTGLIDGDLTAGQKKNYRDQIGAHLAVLQKWSETCPTTFADKAALVSAEIARIDGLELDAMRLYDTAIGLANDQGFSHYEGLDCELAARFYRTRGSSTIMTAYLRKAHACYLNWGARGKARELEQSYPVLRQELRPPSNKLEDGDTFERLDRSTIIRISQAISSEIDLKKLIDTLMITALEYSGGERVVLIRQGADHLLIEAEGRVHSNDFIVTFPQEMTAAALLPESVLRYVLRSNAAVSIEDAERTNPFADDRYFKTGTFRSVLCIPLAKYQNTIGAIYIENNQLARVFTPERIDILSLISLQASISLENARLFDDFQRISEMNRQAETELRHSIDLIPTLAWSVLPDGRGAVFNKRWHDYTGISPEVAREGGWAYSYPPGDRETVAAAWARCVATGQAGEVEARLLRYDGSTRVFLIRTTPVLDAEGNAIKWFGTHTDIDDLKHLERVASAEKHVLELMGAGQSLPSILEEICNSVGVFIEQSQIEVALFEPDSERLRHYAGSGVAFGIGEAIDQLVSKAANDSSFRLPYSQNATSVADIAHDPMWASCRHVALHHGLRTCCSAPVWSFDDKMLGFFLAWFPSNRVLSPAELGIIGQFSRLAGIVVERKQAEDALRRSETLLSEGELISHTGSWTFKPSTRMVSWSAECARMFGLDPVERHISYDGLLERVHSDDREIVEHRRLETMRTGTGSVYEFRIGLNDGGEMLVQSRDKVSRNSSGEITEYLVTILDITDQREKEDEMRRLVSLIENSSECIGYAHSIEDVNYINDAWRRAVGLGKDDPLSSRRMSDFLLEDDYRALVTEILPILLRDGHWEGESSLRRVDSQVTVPVFKTIFFILDANTGQRNGIATICRDITEQKRMNKNLQTSLTEKEALLKEVHHRVKNNLQLISSLLSLQADRIDDVEVAKLFENSRDRVRSMALVHENLYRAGNFANISMRSHVRNLCEQLASAYGVQKENVRLSIDVEEIELDLDQGVSVGLIINELLSNALKHAFPNGHTGEIIIKFSAHDERYRLIVRDNGIGLPLESGGATDETLGLQLIHDLVDQLHGSLEIIRSPGAAFDMSFPANRGKEPSA